jgi:Retrotransposon gag protein
MLSYMQDDAMIWAAPAMEEFVSRNMPFNHSWERFCEQFWVRFETVDKAVDAKEKLCILWQNTSTISKYATLFKELMAYIRYSLANLQDRFYEHHLTCIKDKLVHIAYSIGMLDKLITVASNIDIYIHQHHAERDRKKERKCSEAATGTTAIQKLLPNILFSPPSIFLYFLCNFCFLSAKFLTILMLF